MLRREFFPDFSDSEPFTFYDKWTDQKNTSNRGFGDEVKDLAG